MRSRRRKEEEEEQEEEEGTMTRRSVNDLGARAEGGRTRGTATSSIAARRQAAHAARLCLY
eukprot:1410727-Pyramimonas_sp.AAC.1